MLAGGLVKADHQRPQVRETEPMRHHSPQHPALAERGLVSPSRPFACDDKDDLQAGSLGPVEESAQGVVRLGLTHAVQIDYRLDALPAAPERRNRFALKGNERRKLRLRAGLRG